MSLNSIPKSHKLCRRRRQKDCSHCRIMDGWRRLTTLTLIWRIMWVWRNLQWLRVDKTRKKWRLKRTRGRTLERIQTLSWTHSLAMDLVSHRLPQLQKHYSPPPRKNQTPSSHIDSRSTQRTRRRVKGAGSKGMPSGGKFLRNRMGGRRATDFCSHQK